MPRVAKTKSNPVIPAVDSVEILSRNYVLNERSTLRSTERQLRRNPDLRRELDRVGGLSRILTESGDQVLERDALPRFINLQSTLFMDRLTQGDLFSTPSLETMHETSLTSDTFSRC